MSYIGTQQGTSSPVLLDSITVVNGQAAYTMQKSGVDYTPASTLVMQVSLNGIIQAPNSSYTINGSTITFDSALVTGDVIDYILVREPTTGTIAPVDGSVTDSKIVSMSASKLTGALPALDGSALTGVSAGKLLHVVSTEKTDQFTTTSTSFVDVTGMSASITPSSTSSKILVFFTVGLVGNSAGGQFCYAQLVRGSTPISIGDTAGSRSRISTGSGGDQPYENAPLTIHVLDSPSTTSATTYKIQFRTQTTGTATFNSRGDDADSSAYGRTSASLTLMEIGA